MRTPALHLYMRGFLPGNFGAKKFPRVSFRFPTKFPKDACRCLHAVPRACYDQPHLADLTASSLAACPNGLSARYRPPRSVTSSANHSLLIVFPCAKYAKMVLTFSCNMHLTPNVQRSGIWLAVRLEGVLRNIRVKSKTYPIAYAPRA